MEIDIKHNRKYIHYANMRDSYCFSPAVYRIYSCSTLLTIIVKQVLKSCQMMPKEMSQCISYGFGTFITFFRHLNSDFLTRRQTFFQDSMAEDLSLQLAEACFQLMM